MIEPTESEAKETLDAFIDAMLAIAHEAATEPEVVKEAPHNRPVRRLDEVRAVKHMVLKFAFEGHEPEQEDARPLGARTLT
jgi:glycine dehydrogenase subunit 2